MFYCALFSFWKNHGILLVVIEMDINMKLIGKRIKHRREVSGLSQEQLAEKLNEIFYVLVLLMTVPSTAFRVINATSESF